MPRFWLLKSEPDEYSFAQLQKDRRTRWTGIRNFQARNNLRKMSVGDLALYYHTGDEKRLVGLARVASGPAPDPTAPGEDWTSVELEPLLPLAEPVSLATLKATRALADFPILKQSRLSVAPVSPDHLERVLTLAKTSLPAVRARRKG